MYVLQLLLLEMQEMVCLYHPPIQSSHLEFQQSPDPKCNRMRDPKAVMYTGSSELRFLWQRLCRLLCRLFIFLLFDFGLLGYSLLLFSLSLLLLSVNLLLFSFRLEEISQRLSVEHFRYLHSMICSTKTGCAVHSSERKRARVAWGESGRPSKYLAFFSCIAGQVRDMVGQQLELACDWDQISPKDRNQQQTHPNKQQNKQHPHTSQGTGQANQ